MHVLIADDKPTATSTLAILLRVWGYEPVIVHDGLAALAASARIPRQSAAGRTAAASVAEPAGSIAAQQEIPSTNEKTEVAP